MGDVMMPQKKGGSFGKVGALVGGAAGAYFSGGNPAATASGFQTGGAIGGAVDGMLGGNKQVAPVSTAVQRRIDSIKPQETNAAALDEADQALAQLPEPYQQQYRPAIQQARAKAGGVA